MTKHKLNSIKHSTFKEFFYHDIFSFFPFPETAETHRKREIQEPMLLNLFTGVIYNCSA